MIRENKVYIKSNYSSDSSIDLNSEIISINGIGADVILNKMRKYISAELDLYRDIRVGNDFRRLLWYIHGFDKNYKLELKQNEILYKKDVLGLGKKEFEEILSKEAISTDSRPFSYYQLKGQTIAVINFKQMAYQDKFKNFLDSVFTVVKNNNIQDLIIDIRENSGGDSQLADMLFNYITDKPYKMVEQMDIKVSSEAKSAFKKAHLKWYLYPFYPLALFHPQGRLYLYGRNGKIKTFIQTDMKYPKNEKLKFSGKTYLLTGNYTFSSANMLADTYKCYKMGTIIGEETGGVTTAFGDIIPLQLPNTKLDAFCPHKKFILPCDDGKVHGVIPDIEIKPTTEDIKTGRDAAIEYIIKSVKLQ